MLFSNPDRIIIFFSFFFFFFQEKNQQSARKKKWRSEEEIANIVLLKQTRVNLPVKNLALYRRNLTLFKKKEIAPSKKLLYIIHYFVFIQFIC